MTASGTAGLALIILGLSGTIAFEFAGWHASPEPSLAKPASLPLTGTHGSLTQSGNHIEHTLNEILARPLFSPDRKPVGTSAKSVAGLSRLTGIVVTESRKIAIFAAPAGERSIVAEEGSHINAYEVKSITDSGVTVSGPAGTMVMLPIFDVSSPQVAKRLTPIAPKPALTRK